MSKAPRRPEGEPVFRRRRGAGWTRREFLAASGGACAAFAAGCATNPVTKRAQLLLFSEDDEIRLDRQYAPHQISADFGVLQDRRLNAYIEEVGQSLGRVSHRPHMPYRFQGVNASYVNAYAFPGGTIAVTRAMLLELEDESQLAAVLGHELGHVNARHTAEQMTKSTLAGVLITGLAAVAAREDKNYGDLARGLGGVGSGLLLARYSREDEREADELGMTYAVRAGYPPSGMIGLMDILRRASKERPSVIERLFASHPMSEERYQRAQALASRADFAAAASAPPRRERYEDETVRLRPLKPVVNEIQKGDEAFAEGRVPAAADHYSAALVLAPEDYEALLKLSACRLAQRRPEDAAALAARAHAAYPEEPQALHARGRALIALNRYDEARADFEAYERRLPGNPQTTFYLGRCFEGLGRRAEAIACYRRFLEAGGEGEAAEHARRRLREWGAFPS